MGDILQRLSGAEGIEAGAKSSQNIAQFNAAIQKRTATAKRQQAAFAQKRQAKAGVRAASALTAKLGAAGAIGSPVAGGLIAEQAAETELEGLLIGFEGEVLAQRAESQAELDILLGKAARQRGKSQALAANIQFATTLATTPVGSEKKTLLTGF